MNREYEIRDNRIFKNCSDTDYRIRDNNKIYKNCTYTGYEIRDNKRIYKNCVFMGYEIRDNYIYGNGSRIFD